MQGKDPKSGKAQRLKFALRDNLKKRKQLNRKLSHSKDGESEAMSMKLRGRGLGREDS